MGDSTGFQKFWLREWGARGDIEGVGVNGLDTGLDLEIGGGAHHGSVVAGEFRVGEVDGGRGTGVVLGAFWYV